MEQTIDKAKRDKWEMFGNLSNPAWANNWNVPGTKEKYFSLYTDCGFSREYIEESRRIKLERRDEMYRNMDRLASRESGHAARQIQYHFTFGKGLKDIKDLILDLEFFSRGKVRCEGQQVPSRWAKRVDAFLCWDTAIFTGEFVPHLCIVDKKLNRCKKIALKNRREIFARLANGHAVIYLNGQETGIRINFKR